MRTPCIDICVLHPREGICVGCYRTGDEIAAWSTLTDAERDALMAEVKNQFRPEFVNRIDEVVVFHALGEEHIKSIAGIQLGVLKARLAKMEYGLEVSEAALAELAKAGFDPVYGARPLKRAIQSEIENPLAKAILEGRFAPKDTIRVDSRGGRMTFEKAPARAAA